MLCTPHEHRLTRRRFLGGAAGAVGFSALANPLVAEELKKQKRQVLFVWLDGGMSQLESWDPKPNTPFGGPFRAIQHGRARHPDFRVAPAVREADEAPRHRAER